MTTFLNALRYAFDSSGYSNIFLKVKQIKILEALYQQRDVVAVLPTGYGKSVIFHVLPFLLEYGKRETNGTTAVIVIAPLNSLIDDQICSLRKRGINARDLRGDLCDGNRDDAASRSVRSGNIAASDPDTDSSESEQAEPFNQNLDDMCNDCRILFAHPEQIVSKNVLLQEYQERIVACVIDEAHLIDEWGQEFRPDYSKLCRLASLFPCAPILALTATAPKKTRDMLVKSLNMKAPVTVIGALDRQNIFLCKSKRKPSKSGSKSFEEILRPIANDLKKQLVDFPLTIIYLPLKWCGFAFNYFVDILGKESYYPTTSAGNPEHCLFAQYHSPQTDAMKKMILEQLTDPCYDLKTIRVIFATVAIGLGVNIPDVRQIIHVTVPRTLESYYQQIGRAGRDGYPARAYLYYNGTDIASNKPGLTDEMREYCLLRSGCMRKYIMNYLNSDTSCDISKHECCSNCAEICQCSKCIPVQYLTCTTENLHSSFDESSVPKPVRVVSDSKRREIKERLQAYRLGLCDKIFGGIDLRTGFTLALIKDIVANCEYIENENDILSSYPVWEESHAENIMNIIKQCTQ
ncbi:uncharacterized protein LOC114535437 [Dendronephthya gigantea]|uniref:uncharacterized protein LOC114535437 n=1 Tax=Dendronephthya gigantea TaxID=151771 RepID=UPI001069F50D|nr:uncharacterized protein LOC114535437 [Dendronephthya gigantea]